MRIEELNRDTIIGAASKNKSIAMILPRKVKRHFNEDFRRRGIPKKLGPTLFAAAIVGLFQKAKIKPSALTIDTEYPGYNGVIHAFIEGFFSTTVISFDTIGRNSPAHETAYFTHTQQRRLDGVLYLHDLKVLINKDDRRTVTPRVYRDSQSKRSVKTKRSKKR